MPVVFPQTPSEKGFPGLWQPQHDAAFIQNVVHASTFPENEIRRLHDQMGNALVFEEFATKVHVPEVTIGNKERHFAHDTNGNRYELFEIQPTPCAPPPPPVFDDSFAKSLDKYFPNKEPRMSADKGIQADRLGVSFELANASTVQASNARKMTICNINSAMLDFKIAMDEARFKFTMIQAELENLESCV